MPLKLKKRELSKAATSSPRRNTCELFPLRGPVNRNVFLPSLSSRSQLMKSLPVRTPVVPLVLMKPVTLPCPIVRLTRYVIGSAWLTAPAPTTNEVNTSPALNDLHNRTRSIGHLLG